jgi:hypothetical protein
MAGGAWSGGGEPEQALIAVFQLSVFELLSGILTLSTLDGIFWIWAYTPSLLHIDGTNTVAKKGGDGIA